MLGEKSVENFFVIFGRKFLSRASLQPRINIWLSAQDPVRISMRIGRHVNDTLGAVEVAAIAGEGESAH